MEYVITALIVLVFIVVVFVVNNEIRLYIFEKAQKRCELKLVYHQAYHSPTHTLIRAHTYGVSSCVCDLFIFTIMW